MVAPRKPAKPAPKIVDPLSTPPGPSEKSLSAEEKRIKDLEHQLAVMAGRKADIAIKEELEEPEQPGSDDNILIHFVTDGHTALGRVWYRGQELEFDKKGASYKDTCDRYGRSWLDMDEDDQISAHGKVIFRKGPWRGKSYADGHFEKLIDPNDPNKKARLEVPTLDKLSTAEQAERSRRRAAPRLTL